MTCNALLALPGPSVPCGSLDGRCTVLCRRVKSPSSARQAHFAGRRSRSATAAQINRDVTLDGRGGPEIGRAVNISPEVAFLTADHDPQVRRTSPGRKRGITVGDRAWIATRAVLLPGATVASPASARPAPGCSALAAEHDALLGATGTHPWSPWQEQQIIDTEHYRRVEEGLQVRRLAQQHLQRCTCTWASAGADRAVAVCDRLRAGAAGAAGDLRQLAVPRRARLRAPLGPHARSSPRASRAAASPRRSGASAAYADYVDFLVRTNSIVEHTQLWWSVRPASLVRHRRGAHLRRPDRRAEESTALVGPDRGLRRAGGARLRRGRALRAARGRA